MLVLSVTIPILTTVCFLVKLSLILLTFTVSTAIASPIKIFGHGHSIMSLPHLSHQLQFINNQESFANLKDLETGTPTKIN